MIAARYYCNRVIGTIYNHARLFALLLFAAASLPAQAQQTSSGPADSPSPNLELSDEVQARIAATIAEQRRLKEAAGPAAVKSAASRDRIMAARTQFDRIAAVSEYSAGYSDTVPGNNFSFPEDTHGFCRTYFNYAGAPDPNLIVEDYYLNMELIAGETLTLDLAWESIDGGFADFDLYVFDALGFPVGDEDPAALLDGVNENDSQTDNTNLTESALAINNTGTDQPVLVVVDRFRSSSPDINSTISITADGNDDAFTVTEYIEMDQITYLTDAGVSAPLTEGLELTPGEANDFMASLNTQACAQSVVFTLLDSEGNPVLDQDTVDEAFNPVTTNGRTFSAFDATTVSLPPGTYTLAALPYSGQLGAGIEAPLVEVSFTVPVDDPSWIVLPVDSTAIPELSPFNFTVEAQSSEPGPITYSINPEAEALGASLTPDGMFSWTPIESLGAGTYDITFSASNGINTTDSTITFVVNEVNLAPELAVISDQTGAPGDLISFMAMATDADTLAPAPFTFNNLTYSLEGGEEGMAIDPETGAFTWTPSETGMFTVTVVVTDDGDPNLAASQEVTFNINLNDPQWIILPVDSTGIPELTTFDLSVEATSSEPGPITYTINPEAEAFGAMISPEGAFSWTPIESLGAGTYDITFSASNGINTTDSTITFVVNEVNLAPELAVISDQTGAPGDLISFMAMATDADTLAPAPFTFNNLTYSLEGGEEGMAIDPETGAFTWTPSETGMFTVTVVVTDDGDPNLAASQEVTFNINLNDPQWIILPVDSTGIPELTTFDLSVEATSSEPGPITYTINPEAEAFGAMISPEGAFSWTPIESLGAGTYEVTFSATNGINTTDSTITFVVNEVNLAPELDEIANQTAELNQELTFMASATDADTLAPAPFTFNTLTYSLEDGEEGMAIDPETGAFTWTPTTTGEFSVTVVVTDDGNPNLSDSQVVTITVGEAPVVGIIDFTLINALTNLPVPGYDPIQPGAVIDLVTVNMGDGVPIITSLGDQAFNIQANVSDPDGEIASVDFTLSVTPALVGAPAEFTVPTPAVPNDPGPPYSIYQEVDDGGSPNFTAQSLIVGTYTLSGTPVGPAVAEEATVTFQVVGPRIENFALVNSVTNQDIPAFTPIPEGATISTAEVGSNLNIRANTVDFEGDNRLIDRVVFALSGADSFNKTETFTPYSLFGDPTVIDIPPPFTDANYEDWQEVNGELLGGDYTLEATPFTEDDPNDAANFGLEIASTTFTIQLTGGIAPGLSAPDATQLLPNYPNPFNPVTTIRFGLQEATPVRITVYDMIGREVSVLVDSELNSGFHEVSFDASSLPSGMYLYRLETPTMVQVRPMTLLK